MQTNDSERELAKRRVQARLGLWIHLAMYAVVNVALVGIWAITGSRYPWFLWPLFGWGIGIVGHLLALEFGPDSAREQRAIERELVRMHRVR